MTEKQIAPYQQKPVIPIINGQLVPQDFDGLYRLAQIMAASGMVPKSYVNHPEAVFVAIQMGMEVGLSPMASVQNIAVINGNPSLWGDAVLAIVSGSNLLDDFSEVESGVFDKDDFKYTCTAIRKGRSTPIVREYSIADAKKAGLWGKNTWVNHPKRMVQMRARSRCLRDGFPDLLKGIKVAEEAMDYDIDMKQQNGVFVQIEKPVLKPSGDVSIYATKHTEPELSEAYSAKIKDAFDIDPKAAKQALVEYGTDNIKNITTDTDAERFIKLFSANIDGHQPKKEDTMKITC